MTSRENAAKAGKTGRVVVGLLLFAIVAVGVYFIARPEAQEVPDMPRAQITPDEVEKAMSDLEDRARDYEMDPPDQEVAGLLARLNRAESNFSGELPAGGEEVQAIREEIRIKASRLFARDEKRFLALGEHLSLEFHDALADLLARAREKGLEKVLAAGGPKVDRLVETGGTFMRLADKGLFHVDGALNASPLLPQVLFRRRWCALAGARGKEGLSGVEQRVNQDFIIAFTDPQSVMSRLTAVTRLESMEKGYDGTTARAIVHLQGKQRDVAIQVLKKALDEGRKDRQTARFLEHLETAKPQ